MHKQIRLAPNDIRQPVMCSSLVASQGLELPMGPSCQNFVDVAQGRIESRLVVDKIEYLHIKLTAHDIVFAEGAPSETLMLRDSVSIERYDNFVEYERLYGSKARTTEVPCAPIARMRGDRDRLRSRVRSALSPWLDRRNTFDKARDLLEERAFTTSATGSDFLQNLRNETFGVRAR